MDTGSSPALRTNGLLAALPRRERERLLAQMEPVELPFEEVLYEPDAPIRYVYFPTSGVISLLVVLEHGLVAQVGRVGNEGLVGLPVFLDVPASHTRACVELPGEALRMKTPVFRKEISREGPLSRLLLRYTQALLGYGQRLTACNTWHTIEQRLCRWLLVTQDRVQADQLEITQAFLSQMLGAHRQSITLAAGNLQRAGLIRYRRGKLYILDRPGLEDAACDCYRAIRRQFNELLVEMGR
jgi:CRP-like cAMP-binding protein